MAFPGKHAESCRAGRISNYLKPCCSAIVQIWIFSYDRRFLYRFDHCVYSLEACTNDNWRFGTARWRNLVLYCKLHPSKTNSNKVSRRIFKHHALSLIITHRAELYLSLVGKKCSFFVSALGDISVYALVIFITLSVLMIFSNLTFLDTKHSGVQLVLGIIASSVSRLEDYSSRSESGVKRYSKKPRSFSNEVSINNEKSPFPGQLAESFPLGNISIYLKPCSSTNLQNWIIFYDRSFLYRYYRCVYSLEA